MGKAHWLRFAEFLYVVSERRHALRFSSPPSLAADQSLYKSILVYDNIPMFLQINRNLGKNPRDHRMVARFNEQSRAFYF